MKKILISSLILTSIVAFAYTRVDVDNTNYLANKNIITQQSTAAGYRLDDNITRAEVAGIALKLRGTTLPEGYVCKKYFSDTLKNDWICRATELAADAGLVSRTNATFRPQDKITKAEALALLWASVNLDTALPQYWEIRLEAPMKFDDARADWQKRIILKAIILEIISPKTYSEPVADPGMFSEYTHYVFYPNNSATRAEVFEFAKNILEYKAMMSGEVSI